MQEVYAKSPEGIQKSKLAIAIVEFNRQLMEFLRRKNIGIYAMTNVKTELKNLPKTSTTANVPEPPQQQQPPTVPTPQRQPPSAPTPQRQPPSGSTPQGQPPSAPTPPQQEPTLEEKIKNLKSAIKGLEIIANKGNEDARKSVVGLKQLLKILEKQLQDQSTPSPTPVPIPAPTPTPAQARVLPKSIDQFEKEFVELLNDKYGDENKSYSYTEGSAYYKIILTIFNQRSAWGFVAVKDNLKKGESVGDLLKADSWNAPAKIPRGNIILGDAKYDEYSPQYIR
jgi:hypothetical protein